MTSTGFLLRFRPEGCQNSDSRFEPRFWRPLLCCNLTRAVRARPACSVASHLSLVSPFLRVTRARVYQKPPSGVPENRRSREGVASSAFAGLGVSVNALLLRLPGVHCCSEAARSGSAGRVHQGRGTPGAATPGLGLGSPASASEAST